MAPVRAVPYSDAALRVRVDTLAEDVHGFRVDLGTLRDSMATRVDIAGLREQIAAIASKQDAARTPNWQMWGVAVTILGLIGTILYLPISRDTGRLDTAVAAILDRGVFQRQYDADQARVSSILTALRADTNITIQQQRYNADQEKLRDDLNGIRSQYAPRSEIEATFRERQRQIDGNATNIESLRLRTYDNQGRISKLEEARGSQEKVLDILVNRVNELRKAMSK